MIRDRNRTGACLFAVLLLAGPSLAAGAPLEVHGEDSLFVGHGVGIAWAVLRGPTEAETQVIIRIVPRGGSFAYVRVEGVDPFSRKRQALLEGRPLAEGLDVRSPRGTFADLPRREIHLYRTAADWRVGQPSVTVYYLGVPDTTPEFASEAAALRHLDQGVARGMGGQRPTD
jgi:hypothetical protein